MHNVEIVDSKQVTRAESQAEAVTGQTSKNNFSVPVKPQPRKHFILKRKETLTNHTTIAMEDTKAIDPTNPSRISAFPNAESNKKIESQVTLETPLNISRTKVVTQYRGLDALVGVTKVTFSSTLPYILLEDQKLNRHYQITDQAGKKIYHCGERANWVCGLFQGCRPFFLHLYNSSGEVVVEVEQKCSCILCLCRAECGGARVDILLSTGEYLGSVYQIFTCCTPTYEVIDHLNNKLATIVGKYCSVCFRCDAKSFRIFANVKRDEEVSTEIVATIGSKYLELKNDMSVEMKCLLLGATFLLEMNYFRSCRGFMKVFLLLVLVVAIVTVIRFHGLSSFKTFCTGTTTSEDSTRKCIIP